MGTAKSKGTKTFAIAGDVVNTGLIQVPFGLTLREVIFDVGGGIKDGKKFKSYPDRRPDGRMPDRAAPGSASGLRSPDGSRLHDGVGRT